VIREDGYAITEGRGGSYGPMQAKIGRRWAWREPGTGSQRETEETHDFGAKNLSLRDELAAVLEAWRTGSLPNGPVHPATMAEQGGHGAVRAALWSIVLRECEAN
jgi:hypothetical protein